MINGQRVLAVIPARGGSKGILRKNIREIAGKPLLAWTIEEARKSRYIDRLILSSDDDEIIGVAESWDCEVPFVRPSELAQDDTPGVEPVLHAIRIVSGYDLVVLLQPTSPLRTVADIDACIEICVDGKSNACVSVTIPDKSPYWMYELDKQSRMTSLLRTELIPRRQDMPTVVALNGAVYVAKCDWLLSSRSFLTSETLAYVMPKDFSIDIDTEFDLRMVEFILKETRC